MVDAYLGFNEEFEKSKVIVLPVAYEGTVTYGKGTSKGPKAIMNASVNIEGYDEELNCTTEEIGIQTLKELKAEKNPEEMVNKVYEKTKEILVQGKFFVMFGGEHSITSGAVKAFREKYQDFGVLQLDAHSDLRDEYDDSKYSHACVMRRVIEMCPITQVGIRSTSQEEIEFIHKEKHESIFWAKDVYNNDKWFKKAIKSLPKNVYVTLDVDVFDPPIMPSTGTPEPGGLFWYQVLNFLKFLSKKRNIVGFDIVELAPNKDNKAPDFMTAKLAYKILSYKFNSSSESA